MAVVSLPTTVTPGSDATLRQGTAGVAIAAGEVVYLNSITGRYELADADASAAAAGAAGFAMNSTPAAGQPLMILVEGTLNGASGLKPGQTYLLANVPGDLAEGVGDLTEDVSWVTFLAVAISATSLKVRPAASGVKLNLL